MLFKNGAGNVPNFAEAKRRLTAALIDDLKLRHKLLVSELVHAH